MYDNDLIGGDTGTESVPGGLGLLALMNTVQGGGSPFAEALAGGVSAMRGQPNPVLQQRLVAQQAQQQQANFLMQLQRTKLADEAQKHNFLKFLVQEDRAERTLRESIRQHDEVNKRADQSLATTAYTMLTAQLAETKDPVVRAEVARQRADASKRAFGVDVPGSVVNAWIENTARSPQEIKDILTGLMAAEDPRTGQVDPDRAARVQQRFHLRPDELSYFQMLGTNDDARRASGLPSRVDSQRAVLDLNKTRAEAWLATNPQFKDTDTHKGVMGYARQSLMDQGIDIYDLSGSNPAHQKQLSGALDLAKNLAELDRRRDDERRFMEERRKSQMQADIAYDKAVKLLPLQEALIDRRAQARLKEVEDKLALGPKPLSPGQQKMYYDPLEASKMAIAGIKRARLDVDRLVKEKQIPVTPGILPDTVASVRRNILGRGGQDLIDLQTQLAPLLIGYYNRTLWNEPARAASSVFQMQNELKGLLSYPTKQAYDKFFAETEKLIQQRMADHMTRIEAQARDNAIPKNSLDDLRSLYLSLTPEP